MQSSAGGDLGRHAARAEREPAPPAILAHFCGDDRDVGISLACGFLRGSESYRPSISGEDDQQIGLAHARHDGGQRIIITEVFDVLSSAVATESFSLMMGTTPILVSAVNVMDVLALVGDRRYSRASAGSAPR